MPCDEYGNPKKCYTNQSETVNNKVTRQKEAMTKNDKSKSNMSKLEFVRDVWERVDYQQQSELSLAVFGLGEEYEPADFAKYLQVEPERWFEWTTNERDHYVKSFNKLTVDDVIAKKKIEIKQDTIQDEPAQWLEFPDAISCLYTIKELMNGLIPPSLRKQRNSSITQMPLKARLR